MDFRREKLVGRFLDPGRNFAPAEAEVEVRWDPLTGYASRLVKGSSPLLPANEFDLESLARTTAKTCPFCSGRIEEATPRTPPAIHPEGRIRRGRALLFPNLLTYTQYSAVAVYSPDLHYLPLHEMSPELVADTLATHVEFIKSVMRSDPGAVWASINANHMLPSGSSLFHPHLQSGVDRFPSTMQQMVAAVPGDLFRAYARAERESAERYIANTGTVDWLASFAPMGFNEVRALIWDATSPADLDDERIQEIGRGVARVLNLYAELGFQSFNMALYGAPPTQREYTLNLRLVCRSNLRSPYRSDVTYFERLHWQAMVDTLPEELARRARPHFAGR